MAVTVTLWNALATMRGFGAASAFAIPYSETIADFLWRSDGGSLGLAYCREFITPNGYPVTNTVDGNPAPGSAYAMDSTAIGADDHSYACAYQAFSRGAKVWGTIWSFPNAWQGGSPNGALATAHYADGANLLVSYVSQAWALGIPIHYVGMCNEPDFSPSYAQTSWTTAQAIAFIKNNLYSAFQTWAAANPSWQAATGLSQPGIILPQTENWANLATWINAVEADSTALSEVFAYATHQYSGGGASGPPSPTSREIWETETVPNQGGAWDATMTHAMTTLSEIYNGITTGTAVSWHYWFAEDVSDTNNSGLVGTPATNWTNPALSLADWKAPIIPKRAYALGNFSKFVRPGWKRIAISGVPAGVNALAFQHPTNNSFAIVCINTNGTDNAITFNLNGSVLSGSVVPWITDATRNLNPQAPVTMTASSFTATAVNTGVTTFVFSDPGPALGTAPGPGIWIRG